jgi:hypothetical protein
MRLDVKSAMVVGIMVTIESYGRPYSDGTCPSTQLLLTSQSADSPVAVNQPSTYNTKDCK